MYILLYIINLSNTHVLSVYEMYIYTGKASTVPICDDPLQTCRTTNTACTNTLFCMRQPRWIFVCGFWQFTWAFEVCKRRGSRLIRHWGGCTAVIKSATLYAWLKYQQLEVKYIHTCMYLPNAKESSDMLTSDNRLLI